MSRMLCVLDIFGIFADKISKNSEAIGGKIIEYGKDYNFLLREGSRDFILKLMKIYDVAIFTSSFKKNADIILREILNEEELKLLKFVWYRDRCRLDPCYKIDYPEYKIKSYDTIKCIKDIIENPVINYDRKLNDFNIIICDDNLEKLRFNDEKNIICLSNTNLNYSFCIFYKIICEKMSELSLLRENS